MFAHELYEQNKPRVVVTYPGRFQPFHQGHAGVFAQLQKKFGADNVFIVTSNDTSSAKSPFNFTDKYQLITAAGVSGNHIVETNKMYILPEAFDPATTIFITAVGAPDADRLNPDTFTKRDQKDKDGNITKPAGSPSYYKVWDPSNKKPVTADQHGYVVVIPEIRKSVKIKGQDYDVSHGTECRALWNSIRKNAKARQEFLSQMYKKPTAEIAAIYDKIPATANEDIMPDGAGTASPIPGHLEEMGGVGVIASKKQAKDPRYSTSLTQDVRPGAIQKNLRAFKLAEQPHVPLITPPGIKTPQQQAAAQLGYGEEDLQEKWTKKYKKSINCSNPKGFSQKAHCAGRRARQAGKHTKSSSVNENLGDFEIHNTEKLDNVLVRLCELVIQGQQSGKDYGMVASCVIDPSDNIVFGINVPGEDGKRIHAEHDAMNRYEKLHGAIPDGSIIVTTLSPCSEPMEERQGQSCTDLINQTDCHKVYCGYQDPSQEYTFKTWHLQATRNQAIKNLCKRFADTFLNKITEDTDAGISAKDMEQMVEKFLPMAARELELEKLPHIVLQKVLTPHDGQATFGRFVDSEERIYLGIANRHPVDILRTLAHELVHFKQYTNGEMYHGAGDTGSPIENEANAVAGVIMRHFNKKYPDAIKSRPLEMSEVDEDYHPNDTPPGPEFKPTMPQGTVRVDVSDVYDWYKLGQHISNLKGLGHHDFGQGPPSTIMAFGSEEEEHKYIKDLEKTGLTTTDIDPPGAVKGPRQKLDPTYNVAEDFNLDDAVVFHNNLNKKIFVKGKMIPKVKQQLLLIAKDFLNELEIDGLQVEDITVSGSNAAYSYTPNSDLDLHILVDMDKLTDNNLYQELFSAKKTIYNDIHDITINDIPVELYVQDSKQPHVSLGEYSVLRDAWIRKPTKTKANFDQDTTKLKYGKLLQLVKSALNTKDRDKVQSVIEKLKQYRKAGLDKLGEFGPENLAYKTLRSQGYIQQLFDLRNQLHSDHLSIEENFADGRNPGRKGLSQRVGIPKNATIAQLEKFKHAAGEKGRMARWQLNMRRGKQNAGSKN